MTDGIQRELTNERGEEDDRLAFQGERTDRNTWRHVLPGGGCGGSWRKAPHPWGQLGNALMWAVLR